MGKKKDTLRRAFIEADIEYFESLTKDSSAEWVPSERFEKKMKKLTSHQESTRKQWTPSVKRAVCVALVIAIFFSLACSVGAFRLPLFDFFSRMYDEFTSIFVESEREKVAPYHIETVYLPATIPPGYTFKSQTEGSVYKQAFYVNEDGQKIQLIQQTLHKAHYNFDSEGATVCDVLVGTQIGQCFINKGLISVFWTDHDYAFWLSVPDCFTVDEAVEIAASLTCAEEEQN